MNSDPHWLWLIAGMVLITAEMIMPGFYLLWIGIAAVLTGVAAMLGLSGSAQIIAFALFAIVSVFVGRRFFTQTLIPSDDPMLNDRAARMAGQVVTVTQAISDGAGRVRIGDSEWNARGPDAAIGSQVRVTSVAGATVMVEPA